MKQKLFLLLALILFGFSAAKAQTSPNALVLELKDGTSITYLFEEMPKLSFRAEDIVVKTQMFETTHSLKKVQRYQFCYQEPTSVSSTLALGFSLQGNVVSIGSLAPGQAVNVFTSEGKLVQTAKAQADGTAVVSLSSLPVGVYLVSYLETTVKVVKK